MTADGIERYENREVSWLAFNDRVLALAQNTSLPLLERCHFLAIFASNLDEFFQVRVAGLKDQVAAGVPGLTPDGRTAGQQLLAIRDGVGELANRAEGVFHEQLVPALADVGIVFSSWDELDDDDRKHLVEEFEQRIFPVLTPLAVDPAHPFPYISNLSLSLAVTVRDSVTGERRFARVKVPRLLPRFVVLPDGERFVPLEQVIAAHLDRLFPGVEIESSSAFRVTRNADLTLEEEEADDLLAAVEVEVRRRRFGRAVRLELERSAPIETRELLQRELDLTDDDTYELAGPLDLQGLSTLRSLDRPELLYEPFNPVTHRMFRRDAEGASDLWAALRSGDVLVHHPYVSYATSVEEMVRRAALDPAVLAIKITLYRISGDSPLVHSLIRAAEAGKQVVALIEVKARFDEATNIEWARRLERAGVHVVYGVVGLKTHAKTTIVVRDEPDGVRVYGHIATGNYNSKTARVYEDYGLFTADREVGADLTDLFNFLTGLGRPVDYRRLLVAPHHLRRELHELIDREVAAGAGAGRIRLKLNSLVDAEMIDALYAASAAGVQIDLVVRGICCLRAGVPGLSENIRVRSIVGRFLEHSRIYEFAHGADDGGPAIYIGSADLMPRNLDRRVEALVPITAAEHVDELQRTFDLLLADDELAWTLEPDGSWTKVPLVDGLDAQYHMVELELERARS
jgi:polyphosphate kinase